MILYGFLTTRSQSIVNISTQSIFQFKSENNALSHLLPDYALSKNAGTLAMQLIAAHNDPQKLQVVSLHPGVVYAGGWESAGVLPTQLPFDDGEPSSAQLGVLASVQIRS